jgi:retron-type reverse transcriptase
MSDDKLTDEERAKMEKFIERLDRKLAKLSRNLPRRVFEVWQEGFDFGRIWGKKGVSHKELRGMYAESLARIERRNRK